MWATSVSLPPELEGRYQLRDKLGEGGMGVVALCHDERVGRDVALKVLRRKSAPDPVRRGRFVREARIHARLQHPTLVPVYDTTEAGIHIFPRALDFPPGPTWAVLAAWGVLSASIPGIQAGRTRDKLVKTEQRLMRYVWQARQLVPKGLGSAPSFDEDSLA